MKRYLKFMLSGYWQLVGITLKDESQLFAQLRVLLLSDSQGYEPMVVEEFLRNKQIDEDEITVECHVVDRQYCEVLTSPGAGTFDRRSVFTQFLCPLR